MNEKSPRVIIIGAGIGGITMAINLRRKLHFDNFMIYEKSSTIGGTWRDNTYPGCSSDIAAHWYSLSSELNSNWDSHFITQPEIQAYWEDLYEKYKLRPFTAFNTHVERVDWDEKACVHKVTFYDTKTGERKEQFAEIVIQALGAFTAPYFPKDLVGVDKFQGHLWHSQQWRHDVDLRGKRVGVIGNGCSAAQFIPEIAADPTVEVINFCRSRQWFMEKGQYKYSRGAKWAFANIPFLMRIHRALIMLQSDIGWFMYRTQLPMSNYVRKAFTKYMKETAPEKYHNELVPSYPPGCKRIIIDPGYLAALHKPNVNIVWENIAEIVEKGVVLKSGEFVPLDILILGTGFYLIARDVAFRGRNGLTLDQYFESQNGAMAYRGTVFPGFPNVFSVVGPNSLSAHTSALFAIEVQSNYITKLIKPIITGQTKAVEVTTEATNKYNSWLGKRLEKTIFLDCLSYYRGDNREGVRNVTTFPGMMATFWWNTRKPIWNDFKMMGGEKWMKQRQRKVSLLRFGTLMAILSLSLSLVSKNPQVSTTLWSVIARFKPTMMAFFN
ncbi:FAD/NAD(P)-binding domain-containing protein [Hygrophoropsis aurantiaca]|uniref:FAD/NAD(P)-binding domain-containing protein n=1 Tax=Hygrophoropsis aurantiaca TaxID=72124 RepID=A0ACB8AS23_9AGAM|nr:FAD/NAD(P)-binding domain-containing protein [Hygrophoropsis aurantiaca]